MFYPSGQPDHVRRVDAEEDVQDFRPLRPGLDTSEVVVLFLGPEGACVYGILLLIRLLPGEIKDCRRKVAVAAGILVEVVLVVLVGFVETAEGL